MLNELLTFNYLCTKVLHNLTQCILYGYGPYTSLQKISKFITVSEQFVRFTPLLVCLLIIDHSICMIMEITFVKTQALLGLSSSH